MKVRVYDSGLKGYIDRYTLYFPHPKWMVENDLERHGHRIMGGCIPFSFNTDEFSGESWVIRCSGFDDDRTLGYDVPGRERKVNIETLPKEVREWCAEMERVWNDALKYDDDEHWNAWNVA